MAVSPNNFTGGIQFPVQPSRSGGIRMLSGDDYINQLVRVLVGDDESDNPFLELGLGVGAIFANLSDGAMRAQQQKRIKDLFLQLERAQIARFKSVEFLLGPGEGELTAKIFYYSIETDTVGQVETTLRRAS